MPPANQWEGLNIRRIQFTQLLIVGGEVILASSTGPRSRPWLPNSVLNAFLWRHPYSARHYWWHLGRWRDWEPSIIEHVTRNGLAPSRSSKVVVIISMSIISSSIVIVIIIIVHPSSSSRGRIAGTSNDSVSSHGLVFNHWTACHAGHRRLISRKPLL